jgi:xanthine dehydrogenase accessory factor
MMFEIINDVKSWLEQGDNSIVLAVLINLEGSAVRGRGAVMAISRDGKMAGSVSAGCIESTVLAASERIFETGQAEIIKFCQIDDEVLGSVSPCGGEISIALTFLDTDFFNSFCRLAEIGNGGRWGLISSGFKKNIGSLFLMDSKGQYMDGAFKRAEKLPEEFKHNIRNKILQTTKPGILKIGNYEVFSAFLNPVPQLVIIGASHIGIALSRVAELTGYRVTVVDPRTSFARKERVGEKSRLLKSWPRKGFKEINFTQYTAVAVITHDTKIDDQALKLALKTDSFYIGALGSSSTHKERVERLISENVSSMECGTIHSPIGLKIKSATPEEIAISIMAEIVMEYRDKFGK